MYNISKSKMPGIVHRCKITHVIRKIRYKYKIITKSNMYILSFNVCNMRKETCYVNRSYRCQVYKTFLEKHDPFNNNAFALMWT